MPSFNADFNQDRNWIGQSSAFALIVKRAIFRSPKTFRKSITILGKYLR